MKTKSRWSCSCVPCAVLPCAAAALIAFSGGVHAQSLQNQSVEQRLDMLTRVVEQQQKQIHSLENHIVELEMSQRGRGEPGYAASRYGVQQIDPAQPGGQAGGQQVAQSDAGPS